MRSKLNAMSRAWQSFWFESHSPHATQLLRRGVALVLFFCFVFTHVDFDLLYSEQGVLPLRIANGLLMPGFKIEILSWLKGDVWGRALHLTLLASLAGLVFAPSKDGTWLWVRRGLALVAYVLHVSFLHRNSTIVYGVDMIATFYLAFLMFSSESTRPSQAGSVAVRLAQIQLCVIYAYSGMEKLKGFGWWHSDALFSVLSNPQWARYDFGWTAQVPWVIGAATVLTVLWEVYFPALVWTKATRVPTLVFGVLLHLGIGFSMTIPFFAAFMIMIYSAFLSESQAAWWLRLVFRQKV